MTFVLALWVFLPEVRRYVDWRSTFHALSLLSVVPLLALVPGLALLVRDWRSEGPGFRRSAMLWGIAFGYAFVVSVMLRSYIPALFSVMQFCLPVAFGAIVNARRSWLVTNAFNCVADSLLVIMALSAIYGIYQFVAPPPWDSYWAQQANIENSQGATVAFGFRIFGTLNSTGPFAFMLSIALILNLPRVSLRRWYVCLAFVPIVIALALTSTRAAWIGLLIGSSCYLLLAIHRTRIVQAIALIAFALLGSVWLISSNVREASSTISSLSDRFSTLSALDEDKSASERKSETAEALSESFDQPLGLGLGVLGTAAKLGTEGNTVVLDNGYLARLVELGFPGFLFFGISVATALIFSLKAHGIARRTKDAAAIDIIASLIGIQITFLFFQIATDTYVSVTGMCFWASVALASRYCGVFSLAERSPSGPLKSYSYGPSVSVASLSRASDGVY